MEASDTNFGNRLNKEGFFIHNPNRVVYKYTNVDTAKIILEKKTLRFSISSSFNDPFELSEDYIDFAVSRNDLFDFLMKLLLEHHPDISRLEAFSTVRSQNLKEIIDNYKTLFLETKESTLIFCASKSQYKNLMWSHYASMHTGVCIGLKPTPFKQWEGGKVSLISLPVSYTEKIIPANYFSMQAEDTPIGLIKWLCSKSKDWSYEEEVRYIIIDPDNRVKKINGKFL